MFLDLLLRLFLFFFLSGCLQTENSNTMDAGTYGGNESAEFVAAKEIFVASCVGSCHRHSFQASSEAELVSQNLVVVGDAEASPIYYRCVGSTGVLGAKNMPIGGAALTTTELDIIKVWINGIVL